MYTTSVYSQLHYLFLWNVSNCTKYLNSTIITWRLSYYFWFFSTNRWLLGNHYHPEIFLEVKGSLLVILVKPCLKRVVSNILFLGVMSLYYSSKKRGQETQTGFLTQPSTKRFRPVRGRGKSIRDGLTGRLIIPKYSRSQNQSLIVSFQSIFYKSSTTIHLSVKFLRYKKCSSQRSDKDRKGWLVNLHRNTGVPEQQKKKHETTGTIPVTSGWRLEWRTIYLPRVLVLL